MTSYPDEIEADFHQYYGINFEKAFEEYSVSHISTLASQLPKESRCVKLITDYEWSDEMHMLANIEHELRLLIWIQSNAISKHKSQPPKRIESPARTKRVEKKLEATDISELKKAFGLEE